MFIAPSGTPDIPAPVLVASAFSINPGTASHTFTGLSLGPAYTGRRFLIHALFWDDVTGQMIVASSTLNGVATNLADVTAGYTSRDATAGYVDLDTGTTGTLVINFDFSRVVSSVGIAIFASHSSLTYSRDGSNSGVFGIVNPDKKRGWVVQSSLRNHSAAIGTATGTTSNGTALATPTKLSQASTAATNPVDGLTMMHCINQVFHEDYANLGYSYDVGSSTTYASTFVR